MDIFRDEALTLFGPSLCPSGRQALWLQHHAGWESPCFVIRRHRQFLVRHANQRFWRIYHWRLPAEVMIKTGKTTVALYALSPILDSFDRAFREK